MRNSRNRITENIQRFMYGRYGIDQLNTMLLYSTLVFSIAGMIFRNVLIYVISYFCMILLFVRALSKNHNKRYRENQKFLTLSGPLRKRAIRIKRQWSDKTHKYYNCPKCHQTIRVPKGKGKISIRCPKCSREFVRRT